MTNSCLDITMDYYFVDNYICEKDSIVTISDRPNSTHPFAFFDVNLTEEMQHAIDHLDWKQRIEPSRLLDYSWSISEINNGQLKERLDKENPNNHLFSQKTIDALEKIVEDVKHQVIDHSSCGFGAYVKFNYMLEGMKKYKHWHTDNNYGSRESYRVTMALKNVQTPFYNNASVYNDPNPEVYLSGINKGQLTIRDEEINESQVVQALPNQMALFNQGYAYHAFPSFTGTRLFLVINWC